MLKCLNLKANRSFTLIEVMVAILVISVGVITAYAAVQQIFVYTFSASRRLTAAYLAKEGIEIVRNIRDTNWANGIAWDSNLVKNVPPGFNGCDSNGAPPRYCEADFDDLNLQSYNLGTDFHFLKSDAKGFYNYDSGTDTNFSRKIEIEPTGAGLKVTATVYWQERGQNHSLVVQSYLYEWR